MEDINKVLCKNMYNFVKEHINEVTEKKDIFGHSETFENLGFKNANDMLRQIKNDVDIAYWALTELLVWGLAKDYCREIFIYEETDTFTVFRFFDTNVKQRYLICNYEPHKPIEIKEVKKVTKFVEVNTWEDGNTTKYTISCVKNKIELRKAHEYTFTLAFPTEEMRDAFYENFKDLIEECKELL